MLCALSYTFRTTQSGTHILRTRRAHFPNRQPVLQGANVVLVSKNVTTVTDAVSYPKPLVQSHKMDAIKSDGLDKPPPSSSHDDDYEQGF